MFAASTILYKMIVCLSESRGGSSFGESIFSYCGQRYLLHFKRSCRCVLESHLTCILASLAVITRKLRKLECLVTRKKLNFQKMNFCIVFKDLPFIL